MILLLFFIAGLVIGFLRGGSLGGLIRMKLRWIGLIILSFLAESCFAFIPTAAFGAYPFLLPALQLLRFGSLLLFIVLNIRDWRICLAGAGILMNFIVIAANAWRMPVSWEVASIPELSAAVEKLSAGGMPEYVLMRSYAGARLWFLGDVIPFGLFSFIPVNHISAGDILLGFGVMLIVQHGMADMIRGKHERNTRRKPAAMEDREAPAPSTGAPLSEPQTARPQPPVIKPEPQTARPQPPVIKPEPQPARPQPPVIKPEPQIARQQPPDARPQPPAARPVPPQEYNARQSDDIAETKRIPVKLSPRLATIAHMAGRASAVADVGCDHGKLAAWLALTGVPQVIAMDISAKSLAKTRQLAQELGLRQSIQTRVSDGLKKLRHGEADTIVMAGMGGPTMCDILSAGHEKALSAEKLLLQPMNAVGAVRRWLIDNGFRITDERLAVEDDRIYQILAAVPGDDAYPPMSLFDLEVGHLLIENRHPLLSKLLESKIETIDTILSEIAENATPKANARREELITLRQRCVEVLEWLAR